MAFKSFVRLLRPFVKLFLFEAVNAKNKSNWIYRLERLLVLTSPGKSVAVVYISVQKQYLFPPFQKWYFCPSHDMLLFYSCHALFALILPYFAFILSLYFPFFFSFSTSSLPFYISLFFSFSFHIFPPNDIGWYLPPSPKSDMWGYPIHSQFNFFQC